MEETHGDDGKECQLDVGAGFDKGRGDGGSLRLVRVLIFEVGDMVP